VRAPSPALVMSDAQREILESLAKSQTAAHREVARAKALLLAADGLASTAVAYEVGVSPSSVVAWRSRFAEEGLAKLGRVRPGRGRKPQIPAEKIDEIVRLTQESKPEGETHWSCRSMAKAAGVSPATVQRVWSARGLKPHLVRTFKLSNDRRFDEKLIDVVGVYLNPPDKAVVLCMDEKSQIQALDRTQPSLPLKKGRAGTMTHDYKRNGTTTLFAALNVLTGVVIGQCLPRHRNGEFLKFLRTIDHQVPKGLQIHMILDNYGTHTHDNVVAWLDKHPRFHLHFIPTSSSWLNMVERWFRELTEKAIRRGVFKSVPDLIAAIEAYLQANNNDPKPFVWTATAEEILEKVSRGRVALASIPANNETPH
jgi:transposase